MSDPFSHHPGLRGKIKDPEQSFFRNFHPSDLDARMAENGIPPDWRLTDDEREASRHADMAGRWDDDLWVFAYGSLMWDPAVRFTDVRRAHVPTHARRFILKDTRGARGTAERPGLMAALDTGAGCAGLAFRIPREALPRETDILWRRERIAEAYSAEFVTARLSDGPVTALTFTANRAAAMIDPDLSRAEQVRFAATGTGFLGSSLEYLQNLQINFAAIGVADAEVDSLLAEARAYIAA